MAEASAQEHNWLKSLAAYLSIFAGIVSSLAKIGKNGETAFATFLEILKYTGAAATGFAVFASWFIPFVYFENKFVALISAIALFFFEGFIFSAIFGDQMNIDIFDNALVSGAFGGIGMLVWCYGLMTLIKRFN